ncbi:MAG TPA: hypothetical protein VIR30_07485, partial [Nocardioides sp.]
MSGTTSTETVALTVHGPSGSIDLLVPAAARLADVSGEYARQVGLGAAPRLLKVNGQVLRARTSVHGAGLRSGAVLIAALGAAPARSASADRAREEGADTEQRTARLPFVLAGLAAVLAGWLAAGIESPRLFDATVALLGVAALIGVLPFGRHADQRGAVAPAFAASAAFALVWDPSPEMLPLAFGVAGLAAAVAAGMARALGTGSSIVHTVWMITGSGVFVVTGFCVLVGFDPRVAWSLLLLMAVLGARSVPGLAVDVPDQMLLDLERLAVTAWSARDVPRGRRGRTIIRPSDISALLARGSHVVNAAGVAIFVVAVVSVVNLFAATPFHIDHVGARMLAFFAGAAILLAARSYRHATARVLLRSAGVLIWGVLVQDLLVNASDRTLVQAVAVALLMGALLVVAAVATGRGWRSVKWARRAEIGEMLAGAFTVAAVVVS